MIYRHGHKEEDNDENKPDQSDQEKTKRVTRGTRFTLALQSTCRPNDTR